MAFKASISEHAVNKSLMVFLQSCRWEQKSEADVIGNQRKGYPCYEGAESLVTLSPLAMWKVENLPNELGDLAKEIFN